MPLKLNVGLSRKVGEPNFGSRGASVNLELELDSAIVGEPDRLQERIRQMFLLAKQSIDEELHTPTEPPGPQGNNSNNNQARHSAAPNNGQRQSANANGRRSSSPPPATTSQVRALHAIANRQGLNLEAALRDRFDVDRPEVLTIAEASEMIDEMKNLPATAGGRR